MSKLSKAVEQQNSPRLSKPVTNFMGGTSYQVNPLDTLKMVTASSIFGEPSFYPPGNKRNGPYLEKPIVEGKTVLPSCYICKNTETIMEKAIDAALDYDFKATIGWAQVLRWKYNMRLNPQVIMVRAAMHPARKAFTSEYPGAFDAINQCVMMRADEPLTQMTYFMYINGGCKNRMPSILKRSWAKALSTTKRYHLAKYKNHELGMINGVRLCHASSPAIDELMRTGTISVDDDEKTWENLRSEGMGWKEILATTHLGHVARLRNLCGVFTEVEDIDFCKHYLMDLKAGVLDGKQFPFRYYQAIKAVQACSACHHRGIIVDALEECMDIALENYPKLPGKTMCLSDNSGSAWGSFSSKYGTNTVADIGNLSSVITAACSDEGYVGKFGDHLKVMPISKRRGILSQAEAISARGSGDVGAGTEGGIWEFFRDAIAKKEHWDNIFIYSDQQAGHGGLYGTYLQADEYAKQYAVAKKNRSSMTYIDVLKLVEDYRYLVNPKVNVFSVQTAGYDNVLIPEMMPRCALLYGWTGKEASFAKAYIDIWDEIDHRLKRKS